MLGFPFPLTELSIWFKGYDTRVFSVFESSEKSLSLDLSEEDIVRLDDEYGRI